MHTYVYTKDSLKYLSIKLHVWSMYAKCMMNNISTLMMSPHWWGTGSPLPTANCPAAFWVPADPQVSETYCHEAISQKVPASFENEQHRSNHIYLHTKHILFFRLSEGREIVIYYLVYHFNSALFLQNTQRKYNFVMENVDCFKFKYLKTERN